MGSTFPLCLIILWFSVCSGAAVIPFGEESSEFTSSISGDHFGGRYDVHTTNAQISQYSSNLYEKPFKRYPVRAVVKINLKPAFLKITTTDAPSLSGAFITNGDSREDGNTISEITVTGNMRLPTDPKIREKRCGKVNEKLAKITSFLKASKQMGSQYGSSRKAKMNSIISPSRMSMTYKKAVNSKTDASLIQKSLDETETGFANTSSEGVSTTGSAGSESTTIENTEETISTQEAITENSSAGDATETSPTTLNFTLTETVATESSTLSEVDTSPTTPMSTPNLTSSTETDETEASTASTTDTNPMETMTSTTSSTETDETEASTASTTDTNPVETMTPITSSTETDVMKSSTISETSTVETTARTIASSSSSIATVVTTEDSSSSVEAETTSTVETASYSSAGITKEIKTTKFGSTKSTVTFPTHATEIRTENLSGRSSEKTTNSLLTSTFSPQSTETELRLSTGEDGRSSTIDELIEKKTALSPGKIAWIVIGILMVLAAFTGGIFLGHRYRTIYQRKEDTIALVVRNKNHRSYY